jgi:TM2 domain-containing membrane protein YozV
MEYKEYKINWNDEGIIEVWEYCWILWEIICVFIEVKWDMLKVNNQFIFGNLCEDLEKIWMRR